MKADLNGFTLQNGKVGNDGSVSGGGIRIQSSSPTITNNVIRNNQACRGGGIGILSGSPLIQWNTITANSNHCDFNGNSEDIFINKGGGIHINLEGSPEILDNVIFDNETNSGGGIFMGFERTTPIIKRNVIMENRSSQGAGISMWDEVDPLIAQNLITGNQAFEGGGLYWIVGNPGVRLVNNTIADNDAISNGSGLYINGVDVRTELTNNIIVAKPGQSALYCGGIDPTIRFNKIFSPGGRAYSGNCSSRTGMNGNIEADPRFVNPTLGDYHLQQGSPSIDAGFNQAPNLPDTDIDGNPRILDGDGNGTATIDMGTDEFLLPLGLKISLLDESNPGSKNSLKVSASISF